MDSKPSDFWHSQHIGPQILTVDSELKTGIVLMQLGGNGGASRRRFPLLAFEGGLSEEGQYVLKVGKFNGL